MAGIRKVYASEGFQALPPKQKNQPLPTLTHEADQLLGRLAASGIAVPPPAQENMQVDPPQPAREAVEQWLSCQKSDGGRPWIALGPGSNMAVKIWPVERYAEVVSHLIQEWDVWPVIFGGPEDREIGSSLVKIWKRGYVAAGELGLLEGIAAMRRAWLYLGNDTGTMHMAVAAGLKCVAVFSSRDYPGKWDPYGPGHITLRTPIACEGCLLFTCEEKQMECILSIPVDQVHQACQTLMLQKKQSFSQSQRSAPLDSSAPS